MRRFPVTDSLFLKTGIKKYFSHRIITSKNHHIKL